MAIVTKLQHVRNVKVLRLHPPGKVLVSLFELAGNVKVPVRAVPTFRRHVDPSLQGYRYLLGAFGNRHFLSGHEIFDPFEHTDLVAARLHLEGTRPGTIELLGILSGPPGGPVEPVLPLLERARELCFPRFPVVQLPGPGADQKGVCSDVPLSLAVQDLQAGWNRQPRFIIHNGDVENLPGFFLTATPQESRDGESECDPESTVGPIAIAMVCSHSLASQLESKRLPVGLSEQCLGRTGAGTV